MVDLNEAQQARLQQIPRHLRGLYRQACEGRSRKAAIVAFCLECCGWDRGEVARCSAPACPLYPYRPGEKLPQTEAERASRRQTIRQARQALGRRAQNAPETTIAARQVSEAGSEGDRQSCGQETGVTSVSQSEVNP